MVRVFDLEQLRYAGAPIHPAHQPGFNYFLHRHHARGAPEARTEASGMVVMPDIDALAHQAENLPLHGGIRVDEGVQTSVGFKVLGVENIGADRVSRRAPRRRRRQTSRRKSLDHRGGARAG